MKYSASVTFSQRFITRAVLVFGVVAGAVIGGPVAAAPTTDLTWNISSLQPGDLMDLSAVVLSNSPGVKTWSSKGLCKLTLKIAKYRMYPARVSTKTIEIIANTSTTVLQTTPGDQPNTTIPAAGYNVGDIGPHQGHGSNR